MFKWSVYCYLIFFFVCTVWTEETAHGPTWKWVCEKGKCKKHPFQKGDSKTATCLEACKMICSDKGNIWPIPTGKCHMSNQFITINIQKIDVIITRHGTSNALMDAAVQRFKSKIPMIISDGNIVDPVGKQVLVYLMNENPNITAADLTLATSETYRLSSWLNSDVAAGVRVNITANNFFGLRHGLETLMQLFIYNDARNEIQLVKHADIWDRPTYPYRGVMLDTSSNYFSIYTIKKTLDAMATVKLNTFHWHIVDSYSFPFVSERRPKLTKYGAINPRKVYKKDDIRDVVEYGRALGVRVIPELDTPAHVGEGWNAAGLLVCFKAHPNNGFCGRPPCGQLNPTIPEVYNVLEDLYKEMIDVFRPGMFHMGGNDVSASCWMTSPEVLDFIEQSSRIGSESKALRWAHVNQITLASMSNDSELLQSNAFFGIWSYFQRKAADRLYQATKGVKIPIILWESPLTNYENIKRYLDQEDYIIQVFNSSNDTQAEGLLKEGYQLIISSPLYADYGVSSDGSDLYLRHFSWQSIYDSSFSILSGKYKNLVLGGEALLAPGQTDAFSLDGALWPRAAALAERLWAEPGPLAHDAEQRLLSMRERMVRQGIYAAAVGPEWCYQNDGLCSES